MDVSSALLALKVMPMSNCEATVAFKISIFQEHEDFIVNTGGRHLQNQCLLIFAWGLVIIKQ